jgi:hypothetical protein
VLYIFYFYFLKPTTMKKHLPALSCLKFLLAIFAVAVSVYPLRSQTEQWHKVDTAYGMSADRDLGVDNNNNVYVSAGVSYSGHSVPVIIKHNPDGSIAWQYIFIGLAADFYSSKTITDGAGSSIIVGSTPNANYDAVITKVTPTGSTAWNHVFDLAAGYDSYNDVISDSAGNVYAAGVSVNAAASDQRIMLTKFNSGGTVQWTQYYSSPSKTANAYQLRFDSDGNIVLAGDLRDTLSHWQMQVVKFNPSGSLLWHQEHLPTGLYQYQFRQMTTDNAGNVYWFANLDTVTTGFVTIKNPGVGVVKMNSSGTIQWVRKFFRSDYGISKVNACAMASNGTVYMGGYTDSSFVNFGYYTALNPSTGDTLWYQKFSGMSGTGGSVAEMKALGSSLFFTGSEGGIGTSDDYFTAKVNGADGAMVWSAAYNGFSNGQDGAYKIVLDNAGNVIVSGGAREYTSFAYYCTTIKYADLTGMRDLDASEIHASFFPQPFQTYTTLSITMPASSPAWLQICDLSGKTVAEDNFILQPGENAVELNLASLFSGLYICNLKTDMGSVRRKIICRE